MKIKGIKIEFNEDNLIIEFIFLKRK